MKNFILSIIIFYFNAVTATIAADKPVYDYSTPEKALLSLEQAYIHKDLQGAVNSKSFYHEARHMLAKRFKKLATENITRDVAKMLNLAFRKMIKQNGFPKFSHLKCSATHQKINETMVLLTEKCIFPDKGHSIQKLRAVNIKGQWKILDLAQ